MKNDDLFLFKSCLLLAHFSQKFFGVLQISKHFATIISTKRKAFIITKQQGVRSMTERQQPKIKSLGKALNLLSLFTTRHTVWGVSELAERMNITKSNAYNIVSTFCDLGYLRRTYDGKYTLGLKMLEFAFYINQNLGYPTAVYDIMVDTAAKTNEIVYFGLPYGTNVLYLYVVHPAARMGVLPYRDMLGETSPLYCTGIGKAMLAHMPEEEWADRLPEERMKYQPNTITDRDAIFDELRRTRRLGYAVDNGEREPNIRCVGMPVYNRMGQLVAGLSTSGPDTSMTDDKLMECVGILRDATMRMRERIYR